MERSKARRRRYCLSLGSLCSLVLVVLLGLQLLAGVSWAATSTGSLTAGQTTYYDITLPNPQSGVRLVLSTSASSNLSLYTGVNHSAGSQVASSTGKTLHTILLPSTDLTDGASYHVRIYANTALTYSFTDDLKFINSDLAWDNGATFGGTSIITQPDTAGGDYLFRITGQSPVHSVWRNVLKVNSGEADLYLQQGSAPVSGGSYISANTGSDAIYLNTGSYLAGQDWYIRVHATPGSTWQLTSGDLYVQDLTWDNGSASGGSSTISQPSTAAGDYFFRITSQTSAYGAWRTVVNVTGGEADFYLQQSTVPLGDTTYKSVSTGSDGFVLSPNQFANNQIWYIRVHAAASSTWNIFSGDIYTRNLGTVGTTASTFSNVTIGPEGLAYFKATVDANSQAWKLWLNGSSSQIYVSNGKAPVKNSWTEYAEQSETGQALFVPPYLTSAFYLVGIKGNPGTTFTLDSQLQPVTDLAFGASTGSTTVTGYGFKTYRVNVPINQIGWQVNLAPNAGQNPELYIRKGDVPNRWMNDAYSEAPAGTTDSITQVPPTLSDGAWYITVYGSGGYTFNLENKNPVVTGVSYINDNLTPLKVSGSYNSATSYPSLCPPYESIPLSSCKGTALVNDDTGRSGWRYYQVSDINSQLGYLGWQLDLAGQVAGSEIALRRNAVPARWNYRSGGSSYSTYGSTASHVDQGSTIGFLQQPGHQADIWYIGVYTPDQALGAFQLTTREIPAPLKNLAESATTVSNQHPSTWQWFKYTVPVDSSLKGWDLRLKVAGGTPQMVVRRDQLPADFNTTYYFPYGYNTWPSGNQLAVSPGNDWTGRNYVSIDPWVTDKNGYLIMGMGSPLEAGTYYVGVSRQNGSSDTTALSYTLESRGIGTAASSYPVKIQDLAYAGGVVNKTGLAPRDVAWYRITVPADSPSWSLNLVPTQGEAMLALYRGVLPNSYPASGESDSPSAWFGGVKRQKSGSEYFYKYAPNDQAAIAGGDYYLAVVSEGQGSPENNVIGSGTVSYTLTSVGAMPINDKTSTPVTTGGTVSWPSQSLAYGTQQVYRFRVPAGLTSIEVRFRNKVGNPLMTVRQDAAGSGRIPANNQMTYFASESGWNSMWTNSVSWNGHSDVVTIASPVAGDYTVTIAADVLVTNNATYPDAAFDLEVEGMGTTDLTLANDSKAVSSQNPQTWRYFKVTVPVDSNLKGWDLRLKVTGGSPQMVVRRDQLPGSFTTNSYFPTYYNTWPSGYQLAVSPGQEWTWRSGLSNSPWTPDKNSYLIMGMGSPLEAGTYYVGVSRQNGSSDTTALSYTLESRGIGLAASSYPIKIQDLSYGGGVASSTGLAPREVAWYRVTVPADSPSWSLNLVPTQGEAMLALYRGVLPNSYPASGESDSPYAAYGGIRRQKSGSEYFYKYAPNDQAAISSGVYYLAVISEGQGAAESSVIGSGTVSYTLTSVGAMPVADKTSTPVAAGDMASWPSQGLAYGSQKVYRFRVPEGLSSVEVRFRNKTGNPLMTVRQDAAGSGRIPVIYLSSGYSYQASESGWNSMWTNSVNWNGHSDVVTIASPVAGDYTVTIAADVLVTNDVTYPDAAFDLEVEGMGTTDLTLANDSKAVSSQNPQTWRYFKVTVPVDSNLKGWDLRLKVTGGSPQMVVRRDQLPGSFTTNSYFPTYYNTWPSGYQLAVSPGQEWTWRSGLSNSPWTPDKNSYLIMGMGSPLEAGTYYVGVSRQNGSSDTTALSYTLESRGIGTAASSYPVKIQDLAYAGGVVSNTGLAPREVAWYRVTVPADSPSLSLNLVPTQGEAMLALYRGVLPNSYPASGESDSPYAAYGGIRRQKSGSEYFYKYAPNDQAAISSGDYYLAVISEGQGAAESSVIGSGTVNYTLTSVGAMPVADKTSTPVAAGDTASWPSQGLAYGSQKVYRFRVPEGLSSVEVRFRNKTGNPLMTVRQDAAGSGRIPVNYPSSGYSYHASESGWNSMWTNNVSWNGHSDVVTIPSPVAGDYTVTIAADVLVTNNATYPDAAFDLEINALVPQAMSLDGAGLACRDDQQNPAPCEGHLVNQQVAYYRVEVPAELNGYAIAGWKLYATTTSGSATLRVARGEVPGGNTPSFSSSAPVTIVAPPYLSPGTWYLEVKGSGITDYTISSEIISAEPGKHRRSWNMPTRDNQAAAGGAFVYPAGLTAPEIGDSGIDAFGNPILNPNTNDQGTDLAENDWHFYRIVVPDNNAGHLRTIVEALSGKPELYIRAGAAPSPYHGADATNPGYGGAAYDRHQSVNGTMYGSWVPLDRRTELQLKPGDWWLGIKAVDSNIRYRLKLAAGNVTGAENPNPQMRLFQDLNMSGGSYSGQSLPAGAMRYYRVTMPQSSTTQASSVPTSWDLTLNQQVGDVAIFVRDTIPSGQGADGNALNYPYDYSYTGYFQDWYDDNQYLSGNPYKTIETPGTTTFTMPPLRSGATYYLGVYARTDATFDISSGAGAERLKIDGVISFANGTLSTTLAAGEQRLYRIDAPNEATFWNSTAQHDYGIRLYIAQGTVPPKDGYANWQSYGYNNVAISQPMNAYPWQPGYSYYLVVENTTGGSLPFTFTMAGKASLSTLQLTVNGSGTVTTSPDLLSCSGGTCSAQVLPYPSVTFYPSASAGMMFTGWGGACDGQGWYCTLSMDVARAVTATFVDVAAPEISAFAIPAASSSLVVPVTSFTVSDNLLVTGYLLTETDTTPAAGAAGWSGTKPTSYTFATVGSKTLYAWAKDAAGNVSSGAMATTTITLPLPLTLTFAGTGGGSVSGGMSCTSAGSCPAAEFAVNSLVTLIPLADSRSTFSGWSGACTNTSGNCTITMNGAKTVTATFRAAPTAKVGTKEFSTVLTAYNDAATQNTSVIKLLEGTYVETVNFDRNVSIFLTGGYNAAFSGISTETTIKGRVNVRSGTVRARNVTIR